MFKKLIEMLHLDSEPVGIFLGNTETACDIDASPDKRNCVVPFLMSASKGKTISMDEESCNCPGGATGIWRPGNAPDARAYEKRRAVLLLGRTGTKVAKQYALLEKRLSPHSICSYEQMACNRNP